ncbi:MAG: hypothetical protein ACTSUE_13290 [Promethearchaeota archaeon]
MINEDIECRLRVQGAFGLRNGIKQHCMMLNKTMNVTMMDINAEDNMFSCKDCPDPTKRDIMLEEYKDVPTCQSCSVNIGTKIVPEYVELFGGSETYKEGDHLCISCYANVEQEFMNRDRKVHMKKLEELKEQYKRGEIPYSMILDFEKKMDSETT